MTLDEYSLRRWLRRERQLLRELLLMLVVAVVVGVYFLERVHSLLEHNRRETAEALASQVAASAAEFIVTGNRVSLNVIGNQAAALDIVDRVEFRDAAGTVLALAGSAASDALPVSQPVHIREQGIVGSVELWPSRDRLREEEDVEAVFVLVSLCLLALRVLAEVLWRRVRAEPANEDDENLVPVVSMGPPAEVPRALLRISIVNFDRMQVRFTPTLVEEVLAEYRRLLAGVAEVYGARTVRRLGDECALEIRAETRSDAMFQALCAGMLFRQTARRISDRRKAQGRTPLEFKLLVTAQGDLATSWTLCVGGLPGRVHVPEAELERTDLDARVLYQSDRCLSMTDGQVTVRLQPVEQLAQRYQKLIADQAERLSPGERGAGAAVR